MLLRLPTPISRR